MGLKNWKLSEQSFIVNEILNEYMISRESVFGNYLLVISLLYFDYLVHRRAKAAQIAIDHIVEVGKLMTSFSHDIEVSYRMSICRNTCK